MIDVAPVPYAEIERAARDHHAALPSPIDSYLDDLILASRHFRIDIADEAAGFASIHELSLITQFAMDGPHRRYGQEAFRALRRLERVNAALVPTSDGFFLSHALDDYRTLVRQAYFFVHGSAEPMLPGQHDFSLRRATASDAASIRIAAGEFFEQLDDQIAAGRVFITRRKDDLVGYGILVPSAFHDDVASIGMFTNAAVRQQGIGTATIAQLIAECHARGLRPVAGCAYDNHASQRTLERGGMVSPTRLLRIGF